MDKELLEALNNLSLSLDEISKALKKESTSAVSSALKGGDFSKSLESISKEIVQISKDTTQIRKDQSEIIKSQNTIINMLSDIKSDRGSEVEKKVTSPTTVKEVGKSKEEESKESESKSLFGGASKDSSKIKDGVSTIILIAAGVLAIGMAFKLIGKVDVASVLSISLALPIIALAFQKISEMKLKPSEIGSLVLLTVGMSTAIALSSFILGTIQPVGLFQVLTAILISGVFVGVSYGMAKIVDSIRGLGISGAAAVGISFLLPILMVGFSAAIAGSSYFLGVVKPVGLFQAITSILISGVFVGLSYSLAQIVGSLKGVSPATALVAAVISPILLVALSAAIAGASIFIAEVKPVGLFQALTAILIAGVFAAVGWGLNKILTAFKGVGIGTMAAAAIGLPIILIAMSFAIAKSSEFFGEIKPIGIFQALTAILIAATFTVLGFGIGKMLQGFRGVSPATAGVAAVTMPLILIALSYAIKVSSEWLSEVKTIGLSQFLTAIGISVVFVALSFSVKSLMKGISGVSYSDIVKGLVVILALTAGIVAASYLIDEMKPISLSQGIRFVGVAIALGLGTLIMGAVFKGLNKFGSEKEFLQGAKSMLIIAGAVSASSLILSVGDYTKAPGFEWSLQTALSLAIFGAAIWALDKLKIGIDKVILGAISLVAIAGTIWATSHIIADGNYTKYPSMDWIQNVSIGLGIFAAGAGAIGAIIIGTSGIAAGALALGLAAIAGIALGMVEIDKILASGDFSKFPSKDWVEGTSYSIAEFAKMVFLIGGGDALGGLLSTITFGAFKDPLTAGIAASELLAETLVSIDGIFSKSNFDKYPSSTWIATSMDALERFAGLVFVVSQLSGDTIEEGIKGVESISTAIVNSSKILGGGDYKGGPTEAWAGGVSAALQAFSPIYTLLVREKLMDIFGKGVSADQFVIGIDSISSGIVTAAKKFSDNKASFGEGPGREWAEAMQIALGAFSPIYKMLVAEKLMDIFGIGISVKDYTMAIETISGGIVTAATKFQENKSSFVEGPKKEWAEGVAIALGAFSPIYSILMKEKLMNYFLEGSGVSVESYKTAIETISGGIVTAANKFNEFKASFVEGPKKEWAEGVAIALEAFSPIYGYLMKENLMNYFLPGSGVSAESYKNAIVTISQGIITAAGTLKDGGGTYEAGPKKEWAEGVALALGGFSQIFEILSNGSFWSDPVTGEQLGTAIQTIAKSLVEVSKTFGGEGVTFDKDKAPTKEWSEGVKSSLEAFGSVFGFVSENSGWFGANVSDLSSAIVLIGESIKLTSEQLAAGKYTLIDDKWTGVTKTVIETFIGILEKIEENDLSDSEDVTELIGSLGMISSSIQTNSLTLSKGSYTNIIDDKWITGVRKTIEGFIDLMKKFEDFDIGIIATAQETVNSIISSIVNISKKFGEIKFTENLPTDAWIGSVKSSIEAIANLLLDISKTISQESVSLGESIISSILNTITSISSKFDAITYTSNLPTDDWVSSVDNTIKRLGTIIFEIGKLEQSIMKGGAINSITILETIGKIGNMIADFIYPPLPPQEWADGADFLVRKFGTLAFFVGSTFENSILNIGRSGIQNILKTIKIIGIKVSEFVYPNPPEMEWINRVEFTVMKFGGFISMVAAIFDGGILSSGGKRISTILKMIKNISSEFSEMVFGDPPKMSWIFGAEFSIKRIGELSIYVEKNFPISQLMAGNFKVNRVIGLISDIANSFKDLIFTKFPDQKWNLGITRAGITIAVLMRTINKTLSLSEARDGYKKIELIAKSIFFVDALFSKMDLKKTIDASWTVPLSSIISTFSNSIATLSQISDSDFTQGETNITKIATLAKDLPTKFSGIKVDDKTIESIGKMVELLSQIDKLVQTQMGIKPGEDDPITKLAKSFDLLQKSIEGVQLGLKDLSIDKIQSLSNIKSGSILINLIDEDQFNNLINQINARNSEFIMAIKGTQPEVNKAKGREITAEGEKASQDPLVEILSSLRNIEAVLGEGKSVDTYIKQKSGGEIGTNLTTRK